MLYQLISAISSSIAFIRRIVVDTAANLLDLIVSTQAIRAELASQRALLERILAAVEPLPAVGFVFTAELEGQITEGVTTMQMTNSQKVRLTIQPVDKHGNPAAVDGVPAWASSDETIVTVSPDADGLGAEVKAVGPNGLAKVSVTADADLGAGVTSIFGTLDFEIVAGAAVGITLVAGAPEEQ